MYTPNNFPIALTYVLFMLSMLSILHLCLELHLMIDSEEVWSSVVKDYSISSANSLRITIISINAKNNMLASAN